VTYYLKKCKHQELGSVSDGHANRGRYLLISKDERVLGMFPPLSGTQLNDSSVVAVLPLYSDKKVYCNFVYHNSAIADPANVKGKNGRNEYRLYLNRELENNQLLFTAGDIVIIRDKIDGDGDDKQTVYLLDLIKDRSSSLYNELNQIIEKSDVRSGKGGHAIFDGDIPLFENRAGVRLQKVQEAVVAIDKAVTKQIEQADTPSIESLFNPVSFRDFVMFGYESTCAVTDMVIRYDNLMNLEAAHIKPRSHGGLYQPNNGIALCRDIHWAFDKGFFTINDNFEVIVHERVTSEWLYTYHGKQIRIPKDPFFRPAPDNLAYHRDNVFGLFLTSGKL